MAKEFFAAKGVVHRDDELASNPFLNIQKSWEPGARIMAHVTEILAKKEAEGKYHPKNSRVTVLTSADGENYDVRLQTTISAAELINVAHKDTPLAKRFSQYSLPAAEAERIFAAPCYVRIVLTPKDSADADAVTVVVDVDNTWLSEGAYSVFEEGQKIFKGTSKETKIPATGFLSEAALLTTEYKFALKDIIDDQALVSAIMSCVVQKKNFRVEGQTAQIELISDAAFWFAIKDVKDRLLAEPDASSDFVNITEDNSVDSMEYVKLGHKAINAIRELHNVAPEASKVVDYTTQTEMPSNKDMHSVVLFNLQQEGYPSFIYSGLAQYFTAPNGKNLDVESVRKMIICSAVLEDLFFDDYSHLCCGDIKIDLKKYPFIHKFDDGFVVDVKVFDNGNTLTTDIPDFGGWIDPASYIGKIVNKLSVTKYDGYDWLTIKAPASDGSGDREFGLYTTHPSKGCSCAVLAVSNCAAYKTAWGAKKAGVTSVCSHLSAAYTQFCRALPGDYYKNLGDYNISTLAQNTLEDPSAIGTVAQRYDFRKITDFSVLTDDVYVLKRRKVRKLDNGESVEIAHFSDIEIGADGKVYTLYDPIGGAQRVEYSMTPDWEYYILAVSTYIGEAKQDYTENVVLVS